MTKQLWLGCALVAGIQSCSLNNAEDPPLEALWATTEELGWELSTISVGSADTERVYFIRARRGDERDFIAYDRRTGSVVWRQRIKGPCTAVFQGDQVYCPGDHLYAFDARTGRPLWRYGEGGVTKTFQQVAATADDQRVYVGVAGAPTGAGRVLAVEAATGALVWERSFDGPGWKGNWMQSLTLSPEGDLLVAFTAEFNPPTIYSATVIAAVDPATGEERWRVVDGDETTNRDTGGLELWEDLILYSDYSGQEAVAISRRTRSVVWRAPFTPGSFSTRRPPLVADGVAHFTDTLGGLYAVDARTGREVWSERWKNGFLSHAVCGDVVFGDDQVGQVFDRRTGRHLGQLFEDPGPVLGQVAVADDVLYVSASSGVYAFDCNL